MYELLCMNADASNTTSQGRASEDVEAGGAPVAVDPGARARTPSRPGFADPPGFDGPGARRRPGGVFAPTAGGDIVRERGAASAAFDDGGGAVRPPPPAEVSAAAARGRNVARARSPRSRASFRASYPSS